jgi:hypothetical protein
MKSRAKGIVLGSCLMSLCLAPLVPRSIKAITEVTIERKTAVHVMVL